MMCRMINYQLLCGLCGFFSAYKIKIVRSTVGYMVFDFEITILNQFQLWCKVFIVWLLKIQVPPSMNNGITLNIFSFDDCLG